VIAPDLALDRVVLLTLGRYARSEVKYREVSAAEFGSGLALDLVSQISMSYEDPSQIVLILMDPPEVPAAFVLPIVRCDHSTVGVEIRKGYVLETRHALGCKYFLGWAVFAPHLAATEVVYLHPGSSEAARHDQRTVLGSPGSTLVDLEHIEADNRTWDRLDRVGADQIACLHTTWRITPMSSGSGGLRPAHYANLADITRLCASV
jgi:hypothetical protein